MRNEKLAALNPLPVGFAPAITAADIVSLGLASVGRSREKVLGRGC